MNKTVILVCTFLLTSIAFAQNEEQIAAKEKELIEAQADVDAAAAKVNAIKAQLTDLKPIVKWRTGGFQALNFNQGSFTNWAQGGINAISVTALGNAFANYKFEKWTWDNNLDMAYGVIKNDGEDLRKNEDKIDLISKVGRSVSNKLSWASIARFESQFDIGYDFNNSSEDRPIISKFLAPAYLKLSIGIDYKPNQYLSLYISPAAGKWTIVNDDSIAALNLYIPSTHENPNFRGEFGALTSMVYQNKRIVKNIGIRSGLELFNNYSDLNKSNRKNIDVDWQTRIDFSISKYIGVNILTHVKYDHDTKIEYDPDGKPGVQGPRTQFKELFGLGFKYKF
ncbi:MAG: hypothetical protein ACI83I_000769 [Bacteroidia bacterium]|jgi:hypothetical protein